MPRRSCIATRLILFWRRGITPALLVAFSLFGLSPSPISRSASTRSANTPATSHPVPRAVRADETSPRAAPSKIARRRGRARISHPRPSHRSWPSTEIVHPAIASMPLEAEKSVATIARYIEVNVPDPIERAKAVHDFVATRLAYDVPSYRRNRFPPQDADSVLRARVAVCAGYAQLFEAIGSAAGLDVEYLIGEARVPGTHGEPESHAWNAVWLEGAWYLLDPTWDAGTVTGDRYEARYSTLYFLTPPEVFGADHFPNDPTWQLRERPMRRKTFERQPILSPRLHAHGFTLLTPDRSRVSVDDAFEARLRSDRGLYLMASVRPHGQSADALRCDVRGTIELSVRCALGDPGSYDVWFFTSDEPYTGYRSVGSFQVERR